MGLAPNDKLAIAREYEKTHLRDIERATEDGMEILMREIFTRRKDQTRKYADQLALRIDLQDPLLDITEKTKISSYIRQKYREYGVPETIINNISGDLPDEYKNKDLAREQLVTANGDQLIADSTTPEVKKMDNLRLQNEDEKLAEEEKELKAKLARVRDVRDIVHEEASERHLSLPSMRPEIDSTPKGDPKMTEAYVALGEHIETLQTIRQKLYEFPPTPEDAVIIARGIRKYNAAFIGNADEKWLASIPTWFDIQDDNENHGKHAAGTMNATEQPMILYDAQTDSYREVPLDKKRAITREEVGDQEPTIYEMAKDFCDAIPIIRWMVDFHHNKYQSPNIAQRRNVKSPKFSNSA